MVSGASIVDSQTLLKKCEIGTPETKTKTKKKAEKKLHSVRFSETDDILFAIWKVSGCNWV